MRQKEIELLLRYYIHKEERLRMDITDYEDRYHLRKCDQVDHLESIIAITRYQAFQEFCNEIFRLLNLSNSDI